MSCVAWFLQHQGIRLSRLVSEPGLCARPCLLWAGAKEGPSPIMMSCDRARAGEVPSDFLILQIRLRNFKRLYW